jgi:hypothetical protein
MAGRLAICKIVQDRVNGLSNYKARLLFLYLLRALDRGSLKILCSSIHLVDSHVGRIGLQDGRIGGATQHAVAQSYTGNISKALPAEYLS